MNKDLKKLIKELRSLGYEVVQGKKNFKATHPKGGLIAFSISPSCPYAIKHIRADIKRLERKRHGLGQD